MIVVRSMVDGEIVVNEGPEGLDRALDNKEPDWINLIVPDEADIAAVCDKLKLHQLAIRDALSEDQPPKLEDFGDHIFFIVHSPVSAAWTQARRIAVFLHPRWIMTVQRTASDAMDAIAARVEADPVHLLQSPDALAHVVIDHMTAGFESLTASLLEDMTKLEDRVLADASPNSMEAILKMRRRVIGLARVTRSQRDVCGSLCRMRHDALSSEVMPYLRDVYDHILRVFELVESAREGLSVTRDAYLAVVNNRLSEIMRTLTIIATVMMPLSLLAGVYGMNFEWMPMLENPNGFWFLIGGMGLAAAGMLVYFRRLRWF
jgi:magnesium transporter